MLNINNEQANMLRDIGRAHEDLRGKQSTSRLEVQCDEKHQDTSDTPLALNINVIHANGIFRKP